MAMPLPSSAGDGGDTGGGGIAPDINTTPLIDVMLVLLVMLIVTIPVQTHGVDLHLPAAARSAAASAAPAPQAVRIDIDAGGGITWQNEPVASRGDLQLRLYRLAQQPVQPEVHVQPAAQTPYRDVAMVLSEAQRLGVQRIGMVGNERFGG